MNVLTSFLNEKMKKKISRNVFVVLEQETCGFGPLVEIVVCTVSGFFQEVTIVFVDAAWAEIGVSSSKVVVP